MVLGNVPVPGRPTNLDSSRARAYCAYSRCGLGLFGLLSHRPIKTEILTKMVVKPKTTNQ